MQVQNLLLLLPESIFVGVQEKVVRTIGIVVEVGATDGSEAVITMRRFGRGSILAPVGRTVSPTVSVV